MSVEKWMLAVLMFTFVVVDPAFSQKRRRKASPPPQDVPASMLEGTRSHGTEINFDFRILDYTYTSTETNPDGGTKSERTNGRFTTVGHNIGVSVFDEKYFLALSLGLGGVSGGILAGGVGFKDNFYLGGVFGYQSTSTETKSGDNKDESETSEFSIGPMGIYRVRTASTILEAAASIIYSSAEDASEDETSSFRFGVGGSYYHMCLPRVFVGAGVTLNYVSGEEEDGPTDSDVSTLLLAFELIKLKLTL